MNRIQNDIEFVLDTESLYSVNLLMKIWKHLQNDFIISYIWYVSSGIRYCTDRGNCL